MGTKEIVQGYFDGIASSVIFFDTPAFNDFTAKG